MSVFSVSCRAAKRPDGHKKRGVSYVLLGSEAGVLVSRRDGHNEILGCYRKRHPVFLDEAYRDGGSFLRVNEKAQYKYGILSEDCR